MVSSSSFTFASVLLLVHLTSVELIGHKITCQSNMKIKNKSKGWQ